LRDDVIFDERGNAIVDFFDYITLTRYSSGVSAKEEIDINEQKTTGK